MEVHGGVQRPLRVADFPLTEYAVTAMAPDARSMIAARQLLTAEYWPLCGRHGTVLWGRCQGGALYDVYVDLHRRDGMCTCPSVKQPCKHVLGLVLMALAGDVPDAPMPGDFDPPDPIPAPVPVV